MTIVKTLANGQVVIPKLIRDRLGIKADCFAAACAIQEHAVLVTGGQEFKQVEHLMKIEWV